MNPQPIRNQIGQYPQPCLPVGERKDPQSIRNRQSSNPQLPCAPTPHGGIDDGHDSDDNNHIESNSSGNTQGNYGLAKPHERHTTNHRQR